MVRNSSKKLLKEKSTIDEPSIRKESDLPTTRVAEVSPPRFRSEFPTLEEVQVMKKRIKE